MRTPMNPTLDELATLSRDDLRHARQCGERGDVPGVLVHRRRAEQWARMYESAGGDPSDLQA